MFGLNLSTFCLCVYVLHFLLYPPVFLCLCLCVPLFYQCVWKCYLELILSVIFFFVLSFFFSLFSLFSFSPPVHNLVVQLFYICLHLVSWPEPSLVTVFGYFCSLVWEYWRLSSRSNRVQIPVMWLSLCSLALLNL